MVLSLLSLFGIGLFAGGLGALLGVGGGVFVVPALSLLLDIPLRNAVAASLLCVVATSVASSIVNLRRGRVDVPLAVELQVYTVCGAVAAGLLAAAIPPGPICLAFAALVVFTAWQMWPRPARTNRMDTPLSSASMRARRRAASGMAVGAGVVSGLLGVGGGLINTPVIHLLLQRPFARAAATSAYMIGLTAAASALVYLARGDVLPGITGATVLGTLAGAGVASLIGHRIDQRGLKITFTLLLIYVAIAMAGRGIDQF